jgi:5-formyltetrahydrofolate cyclo-ligase
VEVAGSNPAPPTPLSQENKSFPPAQLHFMPDSLDEALQKKQQLRQIVAARRENQQDVDLLSRRIWDKLRSLPEFAGARTLTTYLDMGSEVRTREYVPQLWQMGKRVIVPFCEAHELRLFHLQDMDELTPGAWQILEPAPQWRAIAQRRVDAAELDLILVPGLAFDRNGDRLGWGKGYYDRFLHQVSAEAVKIALAFQCQLVEEIPALAHDVRMDKVITEDTVYNARSLK